MATYRAYYTALRGAQQDIAAKVGTDAHGMAGELRFVNASLLAIIDALVKTLTDAGVVTDAALQSHLDAVAAYDWGPADVS